MLWWLYFSSMAIVLFGLLLAKYYRAFQEYTILDDQADYWILLIVSFIPLLNSVQAFHVIRDLIVFAFDTIFHRETE